MRYQGALLSVLASIVLASDDATSDSPLAVPDALPLDDLRDIPVPTYSVATGTSQEIPYATSAAIAEVAAQVAATPLSVFPAAIDVPINAAGTTDSEEDHGDGGNPNVIVKSESVSKREVSHVAHHLRRRGACSPQPTIANFYNVQLESAAGFRADSKIASVASGASTPAGYFQNFKNLGAANSAMNYLGYTVVNTGKGYDVEYCASKCDAKAGCLSFNIYFERDPTVEPAASCPDPEAFANIKCSFWGTGLDATTANNKGQWRNKFEVAIAGSNAYTSYKLGGSIDGWNGPQKLDNAAMNAPLWDCTDTWTYLGYKLLQAGSVDPRLCAAACDALTSSTRAILRELTSKDRCAHSTPLTGMQSMQRTLARSTVPLALHISSLTVLSTASKAFSRRADLSTSHRQVPTSRVATQTEVLPTRRRNSSRPVPCSHSARLSSATPHLPRPPQVLASSNL